MISFLGEQGQLRVMLDFCGFLKSRASHRRSTGKIIPKQGLVIETQALRFFLGGGRGLLQDIIAHFDHHSKLWGQHGQVVRTLDL